MSDEEAMPHFFFLGKRKLSPYRACGVVGQSPTVLKEKQEKDEKNGERNPKIKRNTLFL